MSANFFAETQEQSVVKATIVQKYFWAWAKVVMSAAKKHAGKIAYIDLFAGPGRYVDGTLSTPLLVLQQAIKDADMRQMLVTIFNDGNADYSRSLQSAIKQLPGIETMKYPPVVNNHEVGDDIAKTFAQVRLVPTLSFIDPWGYKGLSLRLVNAFLKDWGCDCIFFFNYNRINMGLGNPDVEQHMEALFGEDRAEKLRPVLESLSPSDREARVIESLCEALKELGGRYVLPFRFRRATGMRTSHHLVFVSKHIRGYEIMKGIMARESSQADQGVPSFEYNPVSKKYPLLFELTRPLDDLKDMLLQAFSGREMRMVDVYEEHNVGNPFIRPNYTKILLEMENAGIIQMAPPAAARRKGTLADRVVITFPTLRQ